MTCHKAIVPCDPIIGEIQTEYGINVKKLTYYKCKVFKTLFFTNMINHDCQLSYLACPIILNINMIGNYFD